MADRPLLGISLTATALMAVAGCAAGRLVFDVPPPDPSEAAASAAIGVAPVVGVDTFRVAPPIEEVADPDSVLAMLPRDAAGGIDWSAAVHEGVIDPIAQAPGTKRAAPSNFEYDFYFGTFETYFPHSSHVEWSSCNSCHPRIYRTREVAKTSMSELQEGQSCGACHGSVAFGLDRCERCHPQFPRPEGRLTASLENDLVFVRDTTTDNARDMTSLPPSIFSHWTHRIRYRCQACHEALFPMEAGETEILMDRMQMGQNCGACHDGEHAFGVLQCDNCHVEPPEPVMAPSPGQPDPSPDTSAAVGGAG